MQECPRKKRGGDNAPSPTHSEELSARADWQAKRGDSQVPRKQKPAASATRDSSEESNKVSVADSEADSEGDNLSGISDNPAAPTDSDRTQTVQRGRGSSKSVNFSFSVSPSRVRSTITDVSSPAGLKLPTREQDSRRRSLQVHQLDDSPPPRGDRGKCHIVQIATDRGTHHPCGAPHPRASGTRRIPRGNIGEALVEAEVPTEAYNMVAVLPNTIIERPYKHTWVMMGFTQHQSLTWVMTHTAGASAANLVVNCVQTFIYASAVDVGTRNATVTRCKTSDNTLVLQIPPGGLNLLIEIHIHLI
jgi:hypothetical protein